MEIEARSLFLHLRSSVYLLSSSSKIQSERKQNENQRESDDYERFCHVLMLNLT